MLFKEVIKLISITPGDSSMGSVIKIPTEREVFADRQSIRQSEFYQAAATGLRPELMFIVRTIDYAGEPKLKYNNKTYTIIRTYDKDGEMTELICQGVVNRANPS